MPNTSQRAEAFAAADWVDSYEVAVNYNGWRIDRFLAEKLSRASRSQVARIIRAGHVYIGERRTSPATIVRHGDVVEIPRTEHADPDTPSLDEVRVLHDVGDLIVLDKPPGLLVHRVAHEATRTIERFLATREAARTEPVHRIDRETSGAVVCARGADAIRLLKDAFAGQQVDKIYAAVVEDPEGRWQHGERRTLDTPLGFDPRSYIKIRMGRGNLECATHAVCLGRHGDRALLRVSIDHGRQHQIRAHMALFGTPVTGDKLYGMGNDFFADWSATPGRSELVAQLATRWHALHSWRCRADVAGFDFDVLAPLPERLRLLVPGVLDDQSE
jgi:23S rRNA pseudouridine1911/1915/1917 synthase